MNTGGGLVRVRRTLEFQRSLRACLVIFAALMLHFPAPPAAAQQQEIYRKGDAVVTGHSGVTVLSPLPVGAKPEDYAIINQQGATLQIFDLSQMYGPDNARLVNAARFFAVTAGEIGQVFGVTLDDGRDGRGPAPVPSIYATATSVFGLQIVKTERNLRNRTRTGGPNTSWMDGQFGLRKGGGPGSIWKIDGRTGEVSLFANVTFNGVSNSGPALGNITFDPKSRSLFVSDMQTGMIHAFDLKGVQVAVFDHGANARTRLGLPAAIYNPASRVAITSPAFNATKPETWGYAEKARSVWGLAVSGGRLFYAVAEGPEIWSVGLLKNGAFANDARVEIEVRAPSGDPISDIVFGRDGTMYLSQRGQRIASYDYSVLAKSQTASVLRYGKRKLPSGRVVWQPAPNEYAVGFEAGYRNANGGVALGYGYDRFGYIRHDACESMLWSTGELLRKSAQQASQLAAGGAAIVHGLQGNALQLVRPANEGPFKSYFIDFDGNHADAPNRGHVGDVAIWSSCDGGAAPKPPSGPLIRIAKSCSSASLDADMHCRVTLTSTGSEAPKGRVGFSDIATVLNGPAGANKNPMIVLASPDDPDWKCSAVPSRNLKCSISGAIMKPGQSRSVDLIMDIGEVNGTVDWSVRNCATLDGTRKTRCVTRGEKDALITEKTGPNPQICNGGGICDFEVGVFNPGKRTFDGDLFFGDNLTIGGVPVAGVSVDGVFPMACPTGNTLPLQWQCHVTIPPGGFLGFTIQLTLPPGAVPPGVTDGRNCFVATEPGLVALQGNAVPADFWAKMLDPANAGFELGSACVDFQVAPDLVNKVPRQVVNGLPGGPLIQMEITANPLFFQNVGDQITFTYKVSNFDVNAVAAFVIFDQKVAPGALVNPCDKAVIPAGDFATCTMNYIVQPVDMGADIVSPAVVVATF